jgi:hypothetical protein
VGFYPVCEVSVVSPNEDGKDGAVEQMGPMMQCAYNFEKFSIEDFVIPFCG